MYDEGVFCGDPAELHHVTAHVMCRYSLDKIGGPIGPFQTGSSPIFHPDPIVEHQLPKICPEGASNLSSLHVPSLPR